MSTAPDATSRTILGIRFFVGTVEEAVDRMLAGGLLVVPAAPALKDLSTQRMYREALIESDLAIADSSYMVLIWNLLQRDHVRRVSGLEYLKQLLRRPQVRESGDTFWIMAGESSSAKNLAWLKKQGIDVPPSHVYLAPFYGAIIDDQPLLDTLERLHPAHIIVTIGGGNQERLGLYLRRKLSYMPGIHCIGAAIAFLSGDQARIPMWADRLYLGWLFRILDDPKRFIPRYWAARKLFSLMRKYREKLPPLATNAQ
jgi:N-acetylglucosaminyldiphosphoundecaprenol N-acetyl-beta-D-mannosaminyltransferase